MSVSSPNLYFFSLSLHSDNPKSSGRSWRGQVVLVKVFTYSNLSVREAWDFPQVIRVVVTAVTTTLIICDGISCLTDLLL